MWTRVPEVVFPQCSLAESSVKEDARERLGEFEQLVGRRARPLLWNGRSGSGCGLRRPSWTGAADARRWISIRGGVLLRTRGWAWS
jgi:hypothetical protein